MDARTRRFIEPCPRGRARGGVTTVKRLREESSMREHSGNIAARRSVSRRGVNYAHVRASAL